MGHGKLGAYLLLALTSLKFLVNAVFVVAVLGLLVLFGLQFPHAAKLDALGLIQGLHHWGDPGLAAAAAKLGWTWPTATLSLLPIGLAFVLLAAKIGWDLSASRAARQVQKWFPLPEASQDLSASASSQGISVSNTLLALAAVSDTARAKLERRYARVQQKLEKAQHRQCAFLSIGIVDPEPMKLGAGAEQVERSFKAYEEMLEDIFLLTGAWKEAWTPDGVMVCYLDVHAALDAAQGVLKGVGHLNRQGNELRLPFRVCCGLNEGSVAIYEDSKLQNVADRVIDVAGHMHKHARPNTLWLSSEVYASLEEPAGFHPAQAEVDGYTVFEWSPEPGAISASFKPAPAA